MVRPFINMMSEYLKHLTYQLYRQCFCGVELGLYAKFLTAYA